MRRLLGVLLLLLIPRVGAAQIVDNYIATSLPMTCAVGQLAYKTAATAGLYICTATNTWTLLATQGGGGGGAAWGSVTGTLSDQTDLQTALDGKLATAGTAAAATKLATARTINGVNFDGTGNITVTAAGSTLSDTVTVAKGGTSLATLTAHAIQLGNGTSAPTQLAPVAIGQVVVSKGTGADPAYATYALTHASPANQTGNATSTFKMNGLGAAGCTITPTATGRVVFTITGAAQNGTTADSVTWKLAEGTGTPPANAAAATGSVISATGVFKALTGMLASPFAVTSIATGLALNVAVWFDLQVADITGGTAAITAVDCTAQET